MGGGDGENDTDFSMASLARGVVKEVGTLDPVKDYITLLGKGADVEEGELCTSLPQSYRWKVPILTPTSRSLHFHSSFKAAPEGHFEAGQRVLW